MKYIKRVTLENFQSHKFSIIDFKEQLNVIVGPSDSGKSAIIRGIKWALYNEPSGDYFIKEGEKECSVTIEFSDNVKLKRYRSKYKNSYILTNRDDEEVKFEGFGSTIPAEIIETIGIKKIYLDSDESNAINLGEQLEGAFLLGEKSGVRASAIGRLVGVNIIDDALREVLKDNRNLNIQRKNIDDTVQLLENEVKEFDYLDDLKIRAEKVELVNAKVIALSNILNKIKVSYEKLNHIKEESENLSKIIFKLDKIYKLNETIAIIENKNLIYKQLFKYNSNLQDLKKNIIKDNYIISKLKNLDIVQAASRNIERFCNRKRIISNYNERYLKLKKEEVELLDTTIKLAKLPQVGLKLNNIDENYKYLSKLNDLKSKHNNIKKSLDFGSKYLINLSGIDDSKDKTNKIIEKVDLLSKYHNLYNNMLTNKKEIEKEVNNIDILHKNINQELAKYEELLKNLELCPFCLSNIDDDKINHIINHYIGG